MDRLLELLKTNDPAQLRLHGLAVDETGRLVSMHEARAVAERAVKKGNLLQWQWPYRARWEKRLEELERVARPRRMPRGTQMEFTAEEPERDEPTRRLARGTKAPYSPGPIMTVASDDYESIEIW